MLLDLNNATAEDLEASGIFSAYQIYQLLEYRNKFGVLYSIHELAALPGFHPSLIQKIDPYVSLDYAGKSGNTKAGKHMILFNLERPRGNPESGKSYKGPPLKSILRLRSHPWKNLTLALSYEKDAGETFLYRNRPQFLSGFLSWKGRNFVKQLVVGNYQLNQGLGLVNGSGFIRRAGNLRITQQSFSRIKPYASVSESLYEQGIACRMGGSRFQFTLWASSHKFSLSPSAIANHPETFQWLDHQRTSGLFRTGSELEARDLAYRIHSGIQLLFKQRGLTLGLMSGSEWAGPCKKARELIEHTPDPSLQQKLSLHGNWHRGKIQIFGEIASSEYRSMAFLLGTLYHFNDFIKGSLLLHNYGEEYRGSLPSSYGSGRDIRNEQGLAFHLHMETGKALSIMFTGELFRYPAPRYLTQVPSEGYRVDLSLYNPPSKTFQWRARLVTKAWQTSPLDEVSRLRSLQESSVNRLDGQLIYNHPGHFRWLSRLVIGYCSHRLNSSTGYAAVQQFTYNPEFFKLVLQIVLFHVSDWANRIYLYEPGFYYSFNFPAYYGSGQKSTLLLALRPGKKLSFSFKLSGMKNRGNQKWEAGIQLRLNL
jgi:hypothetical protein